MSANKEPTHTKFSLGRMLFYAAGPLLIAYLLLLLGTTYTAQKDLHEATLKELELNLDRRAATLSYFNTERLADLTTLAQDQTLSAYFSNRALGMSMQYGLRSSLINMQKRFEQLVNHKKLGTSPVYLRLTFIDNTQNKLVDVGSNQGLEQHWKSKWLLDVSNPTYTIFQEDSHFHILLLVPYTYKGQKYGTIIAEINHTAVFNKLIQPQGSDKPSYVLQLENTSAIYSAMSKAPVKETLTWQYPEARSGDTADYITTPIPGTPFLLAARDPGANYGKNLVGSPWYLISLAVLALIVLIAVAVGYRTQSHNLVLKAKIEAADRHGKILHNQNRLLEQEIQKRHESESKLAHQANYDPLTELPNRSLAMDRLSQALVRAKREGRMVVGMFIDLDRFKNVNDTLGHDAGDLLLRQAAQRLKQSIRASDTAARLGGDEFLILLPDVDKITTAETICEKIKHHFSHPFRVHDQEFSISASIGVAIGPKNGADAQTLMKSADLALYRAKEAGRATYRFYTHEMNRHAKTRQAIETQLIRAMEKEEFHLLYQPTVDLSDDRIVGAEALIRWTNPILGNVSPSTFIPLAEESGLILEIGSWVIQQAVKTIAGLGSEAAHMRIAVNVSYRQLLRPNAFLHLVEESLNNYNFPAQQLEIEITERLLVEDRPEVLKLLNELTELGVRLVIDDFGTGFSSLSYLKKFPLDVLKVDQSFIRDVLVDNNDASLTKAIIAIAHELGMEAVGEGVETHEQAAFLKQANCNIAQGYYFGRPADADSLWNRLTGHTDTPLTQNQI